MLQNNGAVSILVLDITGKQIESKVLTTAIENITLVQKYSAGI